MVAPYLKVHSTVLTVLSLVPKYCSATQVDVTGKLDLPGRNCSALFLTCQRETVAPYLKVHLTVVSLVQCRILKEYRERLEPETVSLINLPASQQASQQSPT